MKKYNFLSSFLIALLLMFTFPTVISASEYSWTWLSDVRPYHLLPLTVAVASTVESLSLIYVAKVTYKSKTVFFTILCNIISFAAPYVAIHLFDDEGLASIETSNPYGILRIAYVGAILFFEWIAIFIALGDYVESEKRLLWTIFGSNAVTTVLVIIIENILAPGRFF